MKLTQDHCDVTLPVTFTAADLVLLWDYSQTFRPDSACGKLSRDGWLDEQMGLFLQAHEELAWLDQEVMEVSGVGFCRRYPTLTLEIVLDAPQTELLWQTLAAGPLTKENEKQCYFLRWNLFRCATLFGTAFPAPVGPPQTPLPHQPGSLHQQ